MLRVLGSSTFALEMRTPSRPAANDVSNVLFGRTRRRVLGWLYGHADQAYYLRQIVRTTGAAQGAVQRELALLTGAGLITRSVQGRQVYFQANRQSPVFPELQSLLMKTAGVIDVLREALSSFTDDIATAFVFGSAARGELRADSDIDLLVVTELPFETIADVLSGAQERIGRDVNATVYPRAEFRAKVEAGHHFLVSVLRSPHVFVIGDGDELGRLGAQRLADRPADERRRDRGPARPRRARSRG